MARQKRGLQGNFCIHTKLSFLTLEHKKLCSLKLVFLSTLKTILRKYQNRHKKSISSEIIKKVLISVLVIFLTVVAVVAIVVAAVALTAVAVIGTGGMALALVGGGVAASAATAATVATAAVATGAVAAAGVAAVNIGQNIAYSAPRYPGNNPNESPGDDWKWKGKGNQGGDKGNYTNPNTGESLHPDLNHPNPIGPHWDYKDPFGKWWRLFPDGRVLPK